MAQNIKCPNCAHEFPLENAISNEIESNIKQRYLAKYELDQKAIAEKEKQLKAEKEKLTLLAEEQDKIVAEKIKMQRAVLENEAKKKATEEMSLQFKSLQEELDAKSNKLKESQQKELELMRKEKEILEKQESMKMDLEKQLLLGQKEIEDKARKIEQEKNELRFKEYEKKLSDQMELIETMKRKGEQGSMQLQGEVQELALEEMLKNAFPFDTIAEVAKGVRGADAVQIIRNQFGQECGKIIYESKRTKAFGGDWIEKLKTDMRAQGADIAVLVTETMPKDMDGFGEKNGVWICSYTEVKALAHVLRDSIIKIFNASKSQENRGDKMHMLYDYLTSNEFSEQWKAIREGFMGMKISIQKERDAMEKLWKAREKQLEKVLLNAAHIRGSIDGIAGQDTIDLNLLDDGDVPELGA